LGVVLSEFTGAGEITAAEAMVARRAEKIAIALTMLKCRIETVK
jgi:hypothetical protein